MSSALISDLCLKYLLHRNPERQDARKCAVILLHGRAANELDLFDLAPQLKSSYVFSPRAPIGMGIDSYGWFHTTYLPDKTPLYESQQAIESRNSLLQFIQGVQEKYLIRPEHTFLVGFSQGAIMAFGIALHFPDAIAGVAAMSGRILPEFYPATANDSALKDFPLLISHGIADEVLSIQYARDARDKMNYLPIRLTYHEHKMGHDVTELNFSKVCSWLSEQTE